MRLPALPLKSFKLERRTFFSDPALDRNLPLVNKTFWATLISHIEEDRNPPPHTLLDIGCHTGEFLWALSRRFSPAEVFGIEPLAAAREEALVRLATVSNVRLLDVSEWNQIPPGTVDLATSHEVLYLEPDLPDFMRRLRQVLSPEGVAYIVLGCHAENPLWQEWRQPLVAAGNLVYDHRPLDIMSAASSAGLLPSVQPLRTSGWITYDPLRANFSYPDARTMMDHHYRYKLLFRLQPDDEAS